MVRPTLSMVAKERIQLTGLAIVLLLMVTVIFFDVSRLVGKIVFAAEFSQC